jgi:hypothetical protein
MKSRVAKKQRGMSWRQTGFETLAFTGSACVTAYALWWLIGEWFWS